MFVRTQENYREVFKSILGLKPDLRIFWFTLFNTGGRDLAGARGLLNVFCTVRATAQPPCAVCLVCCRCFQVHQATGTGT